MPFFGLKWGQDLENRAAHPHQEFPGVPPSRGFKVAQPANTAVAPRSLPPWTFLRKEATVVCRPWDKGDARSSRPGGGRGGGAVSKKKPKAFGLKLRGTPGELGSPRDFLGGFDFCPYSIILVTSDPEYPTPGAQCRVVSLEELPI